MTRTPRARPHVGERWLVLFERLIRARQDQTAHDVVLGLPRVAIAPWLTAERAPVHTLAAAWAARLAGCQRRLLELLLLLRLLRLVEEVKEGATRPAPRRIRLRDEAVEGLGRPHPAEADQLLRLHHRLCHALHSVDLVPDEGGNQA